MYMEYFDGIVIDSGDYTSDPTRNPPDGPVWWRTPGDTWEELGAFCSTGRTYTTRNKFWFAWDEGCDNPWVDSPAWAWSGDWSESRYQYIGPCENEGVFDSCPLDDYNYRYYRNSQVLRWYGLNTELHSDRVEYYRASNPARINQRPGLPRQPDNEDHFANDLKRTFALYSASGAANAGTHEQEDFYTDEKPFESDTIERKGWQIDAGKLLLKWNVENGFTY
jgi:hypothetical protein